MIPCKERMRIDIHSHTAPAQYVEAIRRDPKSMGCRIEKDAQGRESVVQEIGRSTRLRRLAGRLNGSTMGLCHSGRARLLPS